MRSLQCIFIQPNLLFIQRFGQDHHTLVESRNKKADLAMGMMLPETSKVCVCGGGGGEPIDSIRSDIINFQPGINLEIDLIQLVLNLK